MDNGSRFAGMIFIYVIVFAFALVSVTCCKAYATDIPCGSTYKSKFKGETIRCVMPSSKPAPAPVPTATPVPIPVPTPVPTPPSGVVCSKSVSKVSDVQTAVNASVAGQTVCIEPGTYNFTVAFYPKSGVRIFCKPGAELVFDGGEQEAVRFNTNVTGAIIEGCEIRGGWDGVKDTGKNNITRNNYIHDNKYQGWLCAGCSGSTLEGNRIENNGTLCTQDSWGGYSPRHCHDAYASNAAGYCSNMSGIKVLNNYLGPAEGLGVNFNGNDCSKLGYYIDGTIVEGNEILNTNTGVSLWHGTRNTVIRNNKITIQNPPASNTPVSLRCGIAAWDEVIPQTMIDTNSFNLRADYKKYCQN